MADRNEANRLSKECIVTALIELMKTQDYASITITDITRKAGVSRMAYYRNYSSKEDILNQYMDEVGRSIHDLLSDEESSEEMVRYFASLFEHLGKYSGIGIAAYRAHLGELILTNVIKNMFITFPPADDSIEEKYKRYYIAGAFYSVLMEWIKGGMQEDSETLARILCSNPIGSLKP